MYNGTIIYNVSTLGSNMSLIEINKPYCLCPGINESGVLAILFMIFIVAHVFRSKKNPFRLDDDSLFYYIKLISIVSAITILCFTTKNIPNTLAFLVSFAILGYIVGDRYFPSKNKSKNQ